MGRWESVLDSPAAPARAELLLSFFFSSLFPFKLQQSATLDYWRSFGEAFSTAEHGQAPFTLPWY